MRDSDESILRDSTQTDEQKDSQIKDSEDSYDSDKSRDFRIKEAKKRLGWPETKEISAGAARNLANLSRFLESIPEIKPKTQNQNPVRDTGQVTMLTATGSNSRSSDNSQEHIQWQKCPSGENTRMRSLEKKPSTQESISNEVVSCPPGEGTVAKTCNLCAMKKGHATDQGNKQNQIHIKR